LESRPAEDGLAVRRRRQCPACEHRFTTYERRERARLFIRKRDGARQPFDREKLISGLTRAAHKRPVSPAQIERLVAGIEHEAEEGGGEIEAERVGGLCLEGLAELDRVAYLQFASVYKGFSDPSEFTEELRRMGLAPHAGSTPAKTQFASSRSGGSV
jgi:transcriptional repressor NrdR